MTPSETHSAAYSWRPPTRADLPAIHSLFVATALADDEFRVSTLDELELEFDDPASDPATDARLVSAPDGSLAALARVYANPQPLDEALAHLVDDVHPNHREALHDPVLDWLVAHGTQRLRSITAATGFGGPCSLRLVSFEQPADRFARYERHGFRPLRYFFRMRRDLSQPIPDLPIPDGLTLTTISPEMGEPVRQALNVAFKDHWGHEPMTPHGWDEFFGKNSTARPDLSPVVLDGGQVAAFSANRVDTDENARQGFATGWISTLGTRRPWRKRGLASALLAWSMKAFQADGLQFATLGVDADSPTGALGLYTSLGFAAFKQLIVFGRAVAE